MNVVYVNTPLTDREHAILEKLAAAEGRSKGKQLRHLALLELKRLGFLPAGKSSASSEAAPHTTAGAADPEAAGEAPSHANNSEEADPQS